MNIITVNEVEIQIVKDGTEKYVAIKPICEAIGVDYSRQYRKVLEDSILGSTVALRAMVANDTF